jgi:hypothetical protein
MNNNPIFVCFILTVAVVSLLLLGAGLSLPSQAAPIPAPSLDTALASVSEPASLPSAGGLIELYVQFPDAWPKARWQELWTVVEWQDDKGAWRTVERWQGSMDDASITDGGLIWGKKMWWVADGDLGKGPFRWAIYRDREGRLLGRSQPFYLPDSINAIKHVEVTVGLP